MITLAVVIAVALAGFFAGTRQTDRAATWSRVSATAGTQQAPPGKPYLAIAAAARTQVGTVSSDLNKLRTDGNKVARAKVATEADRNASLAMRATRRAFAGAPPAIPHPIDEQTVDDCLGCHEDGVWVEGHLAPPVSHAHLTSCTQCHTSVAVRWPNQAPPPENSFAPFRNPSRGVRAMPGAPPIISHKLQMRETCISCHGETSRPGLATRHPERKNCRQCHAAGGDDLPWQPGVPPAEPAPRQD